MNTLTRRGLCALTLILTPALAHASVESSLQALKTVLISGLLPVIAVMALGFAAFQFFTGNPNAKQNLMYAVGGSVILFAAQSIVDLIARKAGSAFFR